MKKSSALTAIFIVFLYVSVPAALSGQSDHITVVASESVKELMREKGPDLYIRMGIYKGY